jgi:SAM-dependent methyltransferase
MASDNPAADAYAEGRAKRASGDDRGAIAGFLMAFALAPDVVAYRQTAFEILNVLSGYDRLPLPLMQALARAVTDPDLDIQPLGLVVRNLLASDPRLAQFRTALAGETAAAETAIEGASWLLEDGLLLAVLSRAFNVSTEIEDALTALRRHVCLRVAHGETSSLFSRYPAAAVALTRQCIFNRHVWRETAEETKAIGILIGRSDTAALQLRAAYRPLRDISGHDAQALPPALAELWTQEADERQRADNFPVLTPIAPGLSKAMREQYEAYPYPRWRQARSIIKRRTLHTLLTQAMPHASFDTRLDGDVDVLIAGCGTGLPTMSYALSLARAQFLAVDLSRVSLAYAARMADALGADNVTFAVADITNLAALERRFDFIECSGVLHHMADPAIGLAALRALVHPHGVMKIALYSERGRKGEVAAQTFVKEHGFPDTVEGLREARAAILALPPGHPVKLVAETRDFFTADGLHDLIFNIHESRTSPAAMKRLLAVHGLEVIGVDIPPLMGGDQFRREHPDPKTWADLDLWETFEAANPQVFAQMIHVWCRPV